MKYNKEKIGVDMQTRKQTSIKVDPLAEEEAKKIFKEYNLTVSDINIEYLKELKNRHIKIDKNIDNIINEMNSGLS